MLGYAGGQQVNQPDARYLRCDRAVLGIEPDWTEKNTTLGLEGFAKGMTERL